MEVARPVFILESGSQAREALRRWRSMVRETTIISWHQLEVPLLRRRLPTLVHHVFRALKRVGGSAVGYYRRGLTSRNRGKRP